MAAVKLGGLSAKWGESAKKWVGGFLGAHTVGRAAKWTAGRVNSSDLAVRFPNAAIFANKTLGKVSGATFGGTKGGYDKRFKDFSKEKSDYAKKNIQLNDNDKKRVASSIIPKMTEYEAETAKLQAEFNAAERNYADFSRGSVKPPSVDVRLRKELEDAREKLGRRNPGGERDRLTKEAEKIAKKEKTLKFAQNLESGSDFFTTKARKDAADAIRKEINKGKDKQVLDAIKEYTDEDKLKT